MKKQIKGGLIRYDAVLKDLFQQDHPTLLSRLTGGKAVRESLNVEFAAVMERRADLLLLLIDKSIFHLDFQSDNDSDMPYREGIYGLMAGQKYRRKIRQTVLYTGQGRMTMPDRLDLGEIKVAYRLVDIRDFDAEVLLRSGNPGDYALALLARGGADRLREILEKASRLPGPQREKVLAQLVALSGLRRLDGKLTMEMKSMGIAKYVDDNQFLREIRAKALKQGRAEGRAKGRAEGRAKGRAEGKAEGEAKAMIALLHNQLGTRFGPLPKWARVRLEGATPAQLGRWAKKLLTANTLEEVIGNR
jgi:predicted transposase YdaD